MVRRIAIIILLLGPTLVVAQPAPEPAPESAAELAPPSVAPVQPLSEVELYTRAARNASRTHSCSAVGNLSARVRALDPDYHARVFATDPAITGCAEAVDAGAERSARSGFGGKLGIGLGVPYGGIGGSLELGIPYFAVVAGVGVMPIVGVGWSAGVRAYFLDRTSKVRPHLTAVYGTVGAVWDIFESENSYALTGYGFYGSIDHDVGQPGAVVLTYGLGMLTYDNLPPETRAPSSLKLLFGINYAL